MNELVFFLKCKQNRAEIDPKFLKVRKKSKIACFSIDLIVIMNSRFSKSLHFIGFEFPLTRRRTQKT